MQLNRSSKQIYVCISWILLPIKDESFFIKIERKFYNNMQDKGEKVIFFLHSYILSSCESSIHGIRVNTDEKRKKSFPRNWVVVVEIIKPISCSKHITSTEVVITYEKKNLNKSNTLNKSLSSWVSSILWFGVFFFFLLHFLFKSYLSFKAYEKQRKSMVLLAVDYRPILEKKNHWNNLLCIRWERGERGVQGILNLSTSTFSSDQ